jgi:hypothetical protein
LNVDDSVAVDAKRILLRYGAPIAVLDNVPDGKRIELARLVARASLPEREALLRRLLGDHGFMEPGELPPRKKRARRSRK